MRLILAVTLCSFAALADHATDGAQAMQARDFAKAAREYEAATRDAPKEPANFAQLALALQQQNDFAGAVKAYDRAIALGAKAPTVLYNAACAFARAGDKTRALALLEQVAKTPVASPQQLRGDPDLASLQGEPGFAKVLALSEETAHPCRQGPHVREFDFWLGEWIVRDPQGTPIGRSTVESILDGCVLLESWTDSFGSQGKSFNHVDPATGEWRQTWVDQTGRQTDYRGRMQGTSLVFLADAPGGGAGKLRMTFTPEAEKVRQVLEISQDGKAWVTNFDGLYVPREPRLRPVPVSVREVVAKALRARGGEERLKALRSERMAGHISFGGSGPAAPFSVELKRPGKLRDEITLAGQTTVRTFDGQTASLSTGTAPPRTLGPDELRNLAGSADFEGPLVDARAKGNRIELLGKTEVKGRDAYELRITQLDGQVRRDWIDCQTFLEVKWEGSLLVQGQETVMETLFDDFREVGGIKVPFRMDSDTPGTPGAQRIVFDKVELDVPLDDSRFAAGQAPAGK